MINTSEFGKILKDLGYDFYSGVPCSFLKALINYAINDCEFVMAANEGDAVAICAGAQMAGRKTVALMQNSGLGNAVSPLTSLNAIFEIPVLGFVSLRGEQGLKDAPQHKLMGTITDKMLEIMNIDYDFLSDDIKIAQEQLKKANQTIETGKPFFFIVKKNTFEQVKLKLEKQLPKHSHLTTRTEMIKAIKTAAKDETVFIATTGFTGRELNEVKDEPQNLYMVGSLGCASSIALGISLAKPTQNVITLDGDGSILMRMGNLAVNAAYKPENFVHVLLDNNAHESTGGQFTVSNTVDYPTLAQACGYKNIITASNTEEMAEAVKQAQSQVGPVFIYAKIKQGAPDNLGRPKITPPEMAERLTNFIKKGN